MASGSTYGVVEIDLSRVLWRTRGKHWDYSFILRPTIVGMNNTHWYDVHRALFSAPGDIEEAVEKVEIFLGDENLTVFTSTFIDVRRDDSGRPIVHYIAWFPTSLGPHQTLVDWGRQLLGVLATLFDDSKVFNRSGASLPNEVPVEDEFQRLTEGRIVRLEGTLSELPIARKMANITTQTLEPTLGRVRKAEPAPIAAMRLMGKFFGQVARSVTERADDRIKPRPAPALDADGSS